MTSPAETAVEELRVALGMTQRELAREAGVDHTYLSRYERGQVSPRRRWLRRVSRTLTRIATEENR